MLRILICVALVGAALSGLLHAGALLGHPAVGRLTVGGVLAGLCVLWPIFVCALLASGGRASLARAAIRMPAWARTLMCLVFLFVMGNGMWLGSRRPGATGAQLADFSDVLVVQSFSAFALGMYAMAALMPFLVLRASTSAPPSGDRR